MGLIICFFIVYNLILKNNPRAYKSVQDKFGKLVTAIVVISILSSIGIPEFFFTSLLLVVPLIAVFGVFGLPFYLIYTLLKGLGIISDKSKGLQNEADRRRYEYEMNEAQGRKRKKGKGFSLTGLTRSYPKRCKIVNKFSKKYNLNLTDQEIERIVDASYMSFSWEREIYDMSLEYDVISQWYNRDTGWLRAYFRVFPIQSVSSDFDRQRAICLDVFRQVFSDLNPSSFYTIDECVDAINDKYLTAFDETTFMIAYRFLEANKIHIDLPSQQVIKGGSELERLMSKYDDSTDAFTGQESNPVPGQTRLGI